MPFKKNLGNLNFTQSPIAFGGDMSERIDLYDEVPYASHPFTQTHPDRLATVTSLLGLTAPPAEKCRVLEIGCAAGGNIIPMARFLPGSTFLGIDLSARQIAEGQRIIDELKIPNVELRHCNVLELDQSIGQFDFIICHGVFSWVPEPVQDKIFAVCASQLTANGVAYISYNTLPGWHFRSSIRHMMLFHANRFTDPGEKIRQSRAMLDFLVDSVAAENNPYGQYLRSELDVLKRSADSYVFHEHLEEHNVPIYFSEFNRCAEAHGLQFLAEADLRTMVPGHFPKEVQAALQRLSPDIIYMEQYMDFLRNRTFRQTLLCKPNREPNYVLAPKSLTTVWVAAAVKPESASPDLRSDQYVMFVSDRGITVKSCDPIVKAALSVLAESWPLRMPFDELRNRARSLLESRPVFDAATCERDTVAIGQSLSQFYTTAGTDLVEISLRALPIAKSPGNKPKVSELTRFQAKNGNAVTNARHELVSIGPFERELLMRMDGQHSRSTLTDELATLAIQGKLIVQIEGKQLSDRDKIGQVLKKSISTQLDQFARQSLVLE